MLLGQFLKNIKFLNFLHLKFFFNFKMLKKMFSKTNLENHDPLILSDSLIDVDHGTGVLLENCCVNSAPFLYHSIVF